MRGVATAGRESRPFCGGVQCGIGILDVESSNNYISYRSTNFGNG